MTFYFILLQHDLYDGVLNGKIHNTANSRRTCRRKPEIQVSMMMIMRSCYLQGQSPLNVFISVL